MYKEKELELNICKKKILIVDDEPINLEFFEIMLSKLGFEVGKAIDGLDALEKVVAFEPDLILLDIIMPKLTGWEFTKKLRNDEEFEKYSNIPIIMFATMYNVNEKIEGFKLGVDDYITKPFVFRDILFRIRAVLRHRELALQLNKLISELESNDIYLKLPGNNHIEEQLNKLIFKKGWGLMYLVVKNEVDIKYITFFFTNMDAVFIGQINKNSFIIISDKERIIKLEKFLLEWLIEKSKKDFEFKIIWADEIGCFHDSDSILNEAMKSNSI